VTATKPPPPTPTTIHQMFIKRAFLSGTAVPMAAPASGEVTRHRHSSTSTKVGQISHEHPRLVARSMGPSHTAAASPARDEDTRHSQHTDAASSAASKISPAAFSSRCSTAGVEGISGGFGLPLPNNASAELGEPAPTRADTAAAVAALRLLPTCQAAFVSKKVRTEVSCSNGERAPRCGCQVEKLKQRVCGGARKLEDGRAC